MEIELNFASYLQDQVDNAALRRIMVNSIYMIYLYDRKTGKERRPISILPADTDIIDELLRDGVK